MPNLSFFKMQGTLIEVVDKWCREHLPTKTSELTNDSGFITSAAVPTKTSDLLNDSGFITSAALPTVNDGTLTIKQNGTTIAEFSANQSEATTCNITTSGDSMKVYNGSYTSGSSWAVGTTNVITVTVPSGTILDIIPCCVNPETSWDNYLVISNKDVASNHLYARVVGTGAAQKHTIKYSVLYKE